MIYWELFQSFLLIGAVSFGGGYGMISLIREQVLQNGWMTEEELLNRIAVAESTPGPIAVNLATFVGSSQGGIPGALVATLGVVLPSFVVILLIAALVRNLLNHPSVKAVLQGVRPAVIGLILATALTMLMGTLLGVSTLSDPIRPDAFAILILFVLLIADVAYRKWRKSAPSPILLILLSAGLGIIFYL